MLEIRTFGRIADADPDPLKIRADRGSRIMDLAPSDIRQILQIRLPNADPDYIIKIESIFQGADMLVLKLVYKYEYKSFRQDD